jgi:hypothetical protein
LKRKAMIRFEQRDIDLRPLRALADRAQRAVRAL